MKDKIHDRKLGALYGALIGDACGCPYEFNDPNKLPPIDQIDMTPPTGFPRTWGKIPVGTYTDDGAQTLILLETLQSGNDLLVTLRAKLLAWLGGGYMSVDNVTFDSGMQTKHALMYCNSVEEVANKLSDERSSGNGSLMRCIGPALIAPSMETAMVIGAKQSLATHPNTRCQMICALYSGIAYKMLLGADLDHAIDAAFTIAHQIFPENKIELMFIADAESVKPTGTGYVVDAFWSAIFALGAGNTYKEVIKQAIALGNDTDTTACIAGGLAGIKFGYSGLPSDWLELLRGKNLIEPIANKLF